MIRSIITGTGHYLPKNIIKSNHFLKYVFYDQKGLKIEKSNEEIINKFQKITEIEERRYINNSLLNSDIATIAAKRALNNSKIYKEEIDYIISAHNYGDINPISFQSDLMPSIAARVKNKLEIKNKKCRPYDMIFGCTGWIEGMILADQLLQAKYAKNILITSSETLSKAIDPHDRNSMIFSDGAGAAVLSSIEIEEENLGIIYYDTQCNNNEELHYLNNGPSLNPSYKKSLVNIRMNGRRIYEYALTEVPIMLKRILDHANLHLKDIKKILIHQANAKMDYAILKRLLKLYNYNNAKTKDFCKKLMPMTIQKYGNSSVATVPTLLDLILQKRMLPHEIHPGDTILMASLGAGMNINGMIYRFPKKKHYE
ncbi:MAG: 3-oxoacyl-ACP synthase III family protein [Flavobacteriales bacterium]|jgi:3-oxoacyl-[acyl-carrier-protein] synthase-3|uniref:3-oxoacyl-ACP synthase III family protein n=1 Tax=Blattabacterium sp. (Mastotermes darwiniensis) TaxID=39768 RepID=UPI000231DEE2|nr:3-oxoacyl-ACP synthase III family protein [Blattabacterium sp. (Mastotermes darwiniensis)]AER40790.1 3-oxoacyl-[acyl-carrier-protein] synthase III [Blattabacterium sp. (Mastotermes darwiniensis) str. MADAR]MDR1804635.1 3-oxoacyl-ACP synthase III family protein [Flavobacteriales bacterium]